MHVGSYHASAAARGPRVEVSALACRSISMRGRAAEGARASRSFRRGPPPRSLPRRSSRGRAAQGPPPPLRRPMLPNRGPRRGYLPGLRNSPTMDGTSQLERLLAEQRSYYRAIADEYEEHAILVTNWVGDFLLRERVRSWPQGAQPFVREGPLRRLHGCCLSPRIGELGGDLLCATRAPVRSTYGQVLIRRCDSTSQSSRTAAREDQTPHRC